MTQYDIGEESMLWEAGVSVIIIREEKIDEATISASNGHNYRGEIHPFFKVKNVNFIGEQQVGGHSIEAHTSIDVDVSESQLEKKDVIMLMSNLNKMIEGRIMITDIKISPHIKSDRGDYSEGVIPKLVCIFRAGRGTMEEFKEVLEEEVRNRRVLDEVIGFEKGAGEKIAYVLSDGMDLQEATEIERSILGPRNKSVTDLSFDAIGVEQN